MIFYTRIKKTDKFLLALESKQQNQVRFAVDSKCRHAYGIIRAKKLDIDPIFNRIKNCKLTFDSKVDIGPVYTRLKKDKHRFLLQENKTLDVDLVCTKAFK